MKRLGKALVAIATSLAMGAVGFAGASTALAANLTDTNRATLSINNADDSDTFTGYRMLDIVSQSADTGKCTTNTIPVTGADANSDCRVVYTFNSQNEAALKAAMVAQKATPGDYATAEAAHKWLTTNLTTAADAKAFGEAFKDEAASNDAVAAFTNATATEVAETARPVGYYLILHSDTDDTKFTISNVMVGTVLDGIGLTIALKNGTVQLEKKIENPNYADIHGTVDGTSYSIGDSVEYSLTGTLPANYTSFTTFSYTFGDSLDPGLTYNDDMTLSIIEPSAVEGGTDTVLKDFTAEYLKTSTDPTVTTAKENTKTTITLSVKDLKAIDKADNSFAIASPASVRLVAKYSATVNKDAVIGTPGNKNEATLTFSKDPYTADAHGTTPADKVTAYTFQLDVTKKDGNGTTLAGAGFKLYRWEEKKWVQVKDKETGSAAEFTVGDNGEVSIIGLSDGIYKIEESTVPAGYTKIPDQFLQVTAAYYDGNTPEAGTLKSLSLATGTFDETNGTFTQHSETNNPGIIQVHNVTDGVMPIDVINNPGKQLPSTGGMGTTMLYIIGGLIVLAAAGGLTVAVRKRQN